MGVAPNPVGKTLSALYEKGYELILATVVEPDGKGGMETAHRVSLSRKQDSKAILTMDAEVCREKRGDCPPKVLAAVTEFFACRSCAKLYWEGPKSLGSYDLFASIFESFAAKGSGDAAAPLGPPEARVASLVKWSGAP